MYPPPQYPSTTAEPPPPYSSQAGFDSAQKPTGPVDSEERLRKFQYLVNLYEINREFATRLRSLEGYEIVFIVDGKWIRKHWKIIFK